MGIRRDAVPLADLLPGLFFLLAKAIGGLVGGGGGLGGSGGLGMSGADPPKHIDITPFHFVVGIDLQDVEQPKSYLPQSKSHDLSYTSLGQYPGKSYEDKPEDSLKHGVEVCSLSDHYFASWSESLLMEYP